MHLCASHIIKAISNNLSKCTNNKKVRELFLYCFARLQNCTNLKNAEYFVFHIFVVFLSEHESDKFRDSFKIIKEHVHNPSLNLNNILQNNNGVKMVI